MNITIKPFHFNLYLYPGNGSLILGTGAFDWCYPDRLDPVDCNGYLSGQLADLNIWSRVLSDVEIQEYSNCGREGDGDILRWADSQWSHSNVRKSTQSDEPGIEPLKAGVELFLFTRY